MSSFLKIFKQKFKTKNQHKAKNAEENELKSQLLSNAEENAKLNENEIGDGRSLTNYSDPKITENYLTKLCEHMVENEPNLKEKGHIISKNKPNDKNCPESIQEYCLLCNQIITSKTKVQHESKCKKPSVSKSETHNLKSVVVDDVNKHRSAKCIFGKKHQSLSANESYTSQNNEEVKRNNVDYNQIANTNDTASQCYENFAESKSSTENVCELDKKLAAENIDSGKSNDIYQDKESFETDETLLDKYNDDKVHRNKSRMTIKYLDSDMPDQMQTDLVDLVNQALQKCSSHLEIAIFLKKEFGEKYGQKWQCVVGNRMNSSIIHLPRHYIFISVGSLNICLFKVVF